MYNSIPRNLLDTVTSITPYHFSPPPHDCRAAGATLFGGPHSASLALPTPATLLINMHINSCCHQNDDLVTHLGAIVSPSRPGRLRAVPVVVRRCQTQATQVNGYTGFSITEPTTRFPRGKTGDKRNLRASGWGIGHYYYHYYYYLFQLPNPLLQELPLWFLLGQG
jgi:hypothetical protein